MKHLFLVVAIVFSPTVWAQHSTSALPSSAIGRSTQGTVARVLDAREVAIEVDKPSRRQQQARLNRDFADLATRNIDSRYRSSLASIARTLADTSGEPPYVRGLQLVLVDHKTQKVFSVIVATPLYLQPGDDVWLTGSGKNIQVIPIRP